MLVAVLLWSARVWAADGDPVESHFATDSGTSIDTNAELGGNLQPYCNTTTTSTITCAAGTISSTSFTVTSASCFDQTGGTATVCNTTGICANLRYTSIAGSTVNGVTDLADGSLTACSANFAAGAYVYALTAATTLAPRLNVLQDAIQLTQAATGVNRVSPTSLGVSTCAAAQAAIGSTTKTTLVIDTTLNCAAATTFTNNVTLACQGGLLDLDSTANALTIQGPMDCPPQQLFTDYLSTYLNTSVKFTGNTSIPVYYAAWWGIVTDDSTDNRGPIQAALEAVGSSGGGIVELPDGIMRVTAATIANQILLLTYSNVTLRGGKKSVLHYAGSTNGILYVEKGVDWTSQTTVRDTLLPPITAAITPVTAKAARTLTLASVGDAALFTVNDWILIRSGGYTTASVTVVNAEVNRITAIDSGTGVITLKYPTAKAYPLMYTPQSNNPTGAVMPLGIALLNSKVIENVWIENLTIDANAGTVLSGRYVVNGGLRQVNATVGTGSFGAFGSRFITFTENTIHLAGGGTTGMWFGPDTTMTNVTIANNHFTAAQQGRLQMHEFAGPATVTGNVLQSFGQTANDLLLYGLAFGPRDTIVTGNTFIQGNTGLVANLQFADGLNFSNNTISTPIANIVKAQGLLPGDGVLPLWNTRSYLEMTTVKATIADNTIRSTGNAKIQLEDPGSYGMINFPQGPYTTALPIRGYWEAGSKLYEDVPVAGQPAGWVNTRAGYASAPWATGTIYYSKWAPATVYALNTYLMPNDLTGSGFTYKCTTAGTSGTTQPAWPVGVGATVSDGSAVWTRDVAITGIGVYSGYRQTVVPPTDNGHVYHVIMGGTSGTEPAWPTGAGATVTDSGGVTYQEVGVSALFKPLPPDDLLASANSFTNTQSMTRVKATLGTPLVASDFAFSAGFGSTAAASSVTGTDQRWQATFTASGTGHAANPTATLTFKDGTFTTTPIYWVLPNGGTGMGCAGFTWSASATALTMTCQGTPMVNDLYIVVGGSLG
jgi:hypothetical protein